MPCRPLRLSRPVVLAATLLALAGCESSGPQFAPTCPQLSLLQDAGEVVRFGGAPDAPKDARSLALAAHIAAVPASCENAGPGEVRARVNLLARVRRGPAATGDTASVPYFIAITENGKVLNELDRTLAVKFRPNVDEVTAGGEAVEITLPVTKTTTAAAYHLYVGFRLTKAELAYNRGAASE
ncbi:MAG TPA: hypothetical protein VFN46_08965 [Acetobacteraceae bacterium]|nr:hypothetical protein [Acetobacteraceae bacterium]